MKVLLFIFACIGAINCANNACLTVEQIAQQVVKESDHNADGIIQVEELVGELTSWGLNNDSCLSYHDFIAAWTTRYHDHHDTAHDFFNNLNTDGDDALCLPEVAIHVVQFDTSPRDGQIQPAEFSAFMHAVHPDSHQPAGHGCH
ncbi:uncharacterized protein LOC128212214 [Mya arenaria]|uniref:uncharacterized protein LOC128212214 n=1 Tax=Mya arenaria TaxID=6604 RepID=UPI0022E8EDC9|nr:uncharacterized protein LOC128212214 [Mya arenaria]